MKQSKITLALSLAALLGSGLMVSTSASAHEHRSGHKSDRHQHRQHDQHRERGHRRGHHRDDNGWYLQRHREVRYYDHRPVRHEHRTEVRRVVQPVYQPVRPHHDTLRLSPLRLEIGYEIVL